jgi:hypothetical protein
MPWRHMREFRCSAIILDIGTRCRWMVSFTSLLLFPHRRGPWYPLDRRPCGPRSLSGRYWEEKNLALPGMEPDPSNPSLYRLSTGHQKQNERTQDRHPFLEWDPNLRSQCWSRRRQFMPFRPRGHCARLHPFVYSTSIIEHYNIK